VPAVAPPLAEVDERLELVLEPQDEAARRALAPGSFSGVELAPAHATLEEMAGAARGVEIARVVENSPAASAGLEAGDLIVSASANGVLHTLAWPSEWRELELACAPGTKLALVVDRAAVKLEFELVLAPRAAPATRAPTQRFREEEHAGVVFRTPTEVEARAAGLAPGAGLVVTGLARTSPWRRAGVRHADLVAAVDGAPVADPEVLLGALRSGKKALALEIVRGTERVQVSAPLTQRETELTEFSIPLLYDYENDRGHRTTSALLGLYKYESTKVAWRLRLLWFIVFSGGDADRLEELGS
jgi:C-terminal processing protease CtpA/Prc